MVNERVLLKAYRRIETGLNPELEVLAFLTEVAGFSAAPPLTGYAEVVSGSSGAATVAIAQAFEAGGVDAFETIAEQLAG